MSTVSPVSPAPNPLIEYILERNPQNIMELREHANAAMLSQFNEGLPEIGKSLDDIEISSIADGMLSLDVHIPKGNGPFPIVIFFHGGGWSSGSTKTHRKLCFRIAEAGLLVFNVDYRLAPEHPFPAAFEDSKTAYEWVLKHAEEYSGDLSRLTLAGDSAGGLIASSLAVELSQAGETQVKALGLIYPALEFESWPAQIAAIPDGVPNMNKRIFDAVFGAELDCDLSNPRFSPLNAADKFPPTFITCSREDVSVWDGCNTLPKRLEEAEIKCVSDFHENLPHGFAQMEEWFPEARRSIAKMTRFLLEHT